MSIFFTSDNHWGHERIVQYCNRPFTDVYHMNEVMVAKWNAKVTSEDTVFVLGDFSLTFSNVERYLPRLNGIKILVPGNHDLCHPANRKFKQGIWVEKYQEVGFTSVLPLICRDKRLPGNILLCHMPEGEIGDRYPQYRPKLSKDDLLLCGHVHDRWKFKRNQINCGVDQWNFEPMELNELLNEYFTQGIK